MKRIHIHIAVEKMLESKNFYQILFGVSPSIEREDYVKWEINNPALNFAISKRGQQPGINHLGIQVESDEELAEISGRFKKAEHTFSEQKGASCCYAHSNKHWSFDPSGVAWESFHTIGNLTIFGSDTTNEDANEGGACCIPINNGKGNDKAACCIPNENDVGNCCY